MAAMASGALVFLFVLLILILAGLVVVIALWLREGGIFPGDRNERIHREILKEIETRLDKFEQLVREAEKLEAGLAKAALRTKQAMDLISAAKITETIREAISNDALEGVRDEKQGADTADAGGEQFQTASDSAYSQMQFEQVKSTSRMDDTLAEKVLKLSGEGLETAEIAKRLGIGKSEVELLIKFSGGKSGI